MTPFQKTWRIVLILSSLIHLIIFVGLLFQGFIDLRSPIIFVDYVYAAIYIAFGALAVLIFGGDLKILFTPKMCRKRMQRWEQHIAKIAIASILFLILYLFRFQLSGILFFAGFEIGRFFIRVATSAYQTLFGFDLDNIGFYQLAWMFQWHFLFAVVGIAEAIGKKLTNMARRIL